MKNKPLYFKIWLIITASISILSVVCAFLIYLWSDMYFEYQIFNQMDILPTEMTVSEYIAVDPVYMQKAIFHNEIDVKYGILDAFEVTPSVYSDPAERIIMEKIPLQTDKKEYYKEVIDGKDAMYIIDRIDTAEGSKYAYSFAFNPYKSLLHDVFTIVAAAILIFLFFNFIIIRIICKKMTGSISRLQTHADKIAFQDWNEAIDVNKFNHSAEVIDLASSFEQMRRMLVQRDENMQSMLQYISHELKTPIMVIRSYIDAAKDGIYPKGTLDSSLNIMETQSLRLQEKVTDLLYITKLEESKLNKISRVETAIGELLSKTLSNYEFAGKDLIMEKNIQPGININCDIHNITVLFENIIENIIRHADKKIIISLKRERDLVRIMFYNDGEPIEADVKNKMFKPFEKGQNGNVGLGLSICNKIVEIHGGKIRIPQTARGCIFIIYLPCICASS